MVNWIGRRIGGWTFWSWLKPSDKEPIAVRTAFLRAIALFALAFAMGYACAYRPETTEYIRVPVQGSDSQPAPFVPDLDDGTPDVPLEGASDQESVTDDAADECAEDPESC